MKKFSFILGFSFCCSLGFSNDPNELFQKGMEADKNAKYDSVVFYLKNFVKATSLSQDSLHIVGLNELGRALMNNSELKASDSVFLYSIELSKSKFGLNHVLTAQAYDHLSRTRASQMNFNEALDPAKEGLRIRQKLFGETDTLVAQSYNSLNLILRSIGQYRSALDHAQKALKIWEAYPGVENLETARTYNSLGWLYIAYGELILSLDFNLKSYEIRKKLLSDNHPLLARSLKLIGRCYEDFGQYGQAKNYYEEALQIYISTLGPDHGNVSNSYQSLASIYSRLGNYSKAILYTKEAIRIWSETIGDKSSQIVNLYGNLASAYFHKKDDQNFLTNINKALELAKANLPEDHHEFIAIHSSYAKYHLRLKDYGNQYLSLRKAIDVAINKYGKSHSFYATLINELSDYYFNISDYNESLRLAKEALDIYRVNHGEFHNGVASGLTNMANNYMKLEDFKRAAELYHQSLLILAGENFSKETIDFNPPIEGISAKLNAIKVIRKKGLALQKIRLQDPNNKEAIELANQTFLKGIEYIESLRNSYSTEDDKIQLFETGSLMYAGAIDGLVFQYGLSGDKQYAEKAFEISEKSKAFVLLQAVHTYKAIKFGNVPDTLLDKNNSLEAERAFFKKKLERARKRNSTDQITLYEKALFDNQIKIDSLVTYIEKNYNKYYQLKYQLQPSSIASVQERMADHTAAVIEYFISENHLYTFSITNKGLQVHKQELPTNFDDIISDYRKSLSSYDFILNNKEEANELFAVNSHRLYELLLKEQLDQMENVQSLIIIPDGKIGLINLDALIQNPIEEREIHYSSQSYLLNEYALSYSYSATFLTNSILQKTSKKRKVFGGYAPSYANISDNQNAVLRLGVADLPNAKKEVVEISNLIGGDPWTGSNVGKQFFKEKATSYQINHLALHGVLDDLDPLNSYLAFGTGEENRLTIEEIYGLKLDADLIVLSACESGNGRINSGEGNMSLSRAFNYAGAPSVVMSLWQTGDLESSKLMVDFYRALSKGNNKAKSLQQAKLNYLKNTSDPLYSHPFFWAGFMLVGNHEPMEFDKSYEYKTALSLVSMIFFILIAYRVRRRRKIH